MFGGAGGDRVFAGAGQLIVDARGGDDLIFGGGRATCSSGTVKTSATAWAVTGCSATPGR
jgi:hypothetical protein